MRPLRSESFLRKDEVRAGTGRDRTRDMQFAAISVLSIIDQFALRKPRRYRSISGRVPRGA